MTFGRRFIVDRFVSLPIKKQKIIIDSALKSFGTNGYKKASISDIAAAAGISKAMIFHYFGTKKALYLYLINLCGNIIMDEINEKFDNSVTDFFERIKISTNIEISVMKRHPAIPAFLTSVYFETGDEVKEDIKSILAKGEDFRNKIAFDGMDVSKFKDGIDPKLVMKMLTWLADGYAKQLSSRTDIDIDFMCNEIFECMDLLKNNFYKEEYL
jgi:TetR/AcrR family transcriptional regulator